MKNKINFAVPVINAALVFLSCAALFKTFVAWSDMVKYVLSLVFVTAVCAFAGFFLSRTGKKSSNKRDIIYALAGAAAAEVVFWGFAIVINTVIGNGKLNTLAGNIAVAVIIVLYGVVSVLTYKNLNTENKKSIKVLSGLLAAAMVGVLVMQSVPPVVRKATEKKYYDADECYLYNLDFYGKLKNKSDVNILIIGDSIGEGSGGEDGRLWFQLLEDAVESQYGVNLRCRNVSFGGNASYCGYVSSEIFSDGTDYDLAVLCYGQNDGSPEELSIYYEAMIRALRTKYDNIDLIAILESPQRSLTPKMQTILDICKYYDIPAADTITPFNNSEIGYDGLTTDGCHPNNEGQKIYYETVMNIIRAEYDKTVERFYSLPEPILPDVRNYDRFRYLRAEEFKRTDDVTFEAEYSFDNALLGMDFDIQSGENAVEFYLDGELFHTMTSSFDFDFNQRHIEPVCSGAAAKHSVKLVFLNKAAADSFRGLIINPDCGNTN